MTTFPYIKVSGNILVAKLVVTMTTFQFATLYPYHNYYYIHVTMTTLPYVIIQNYTCNYDYKSIEHDKCCHNIIIS